MITPVPNRYIQYAKDMFKVMWEQDHAFTGYQNIVFYESVETGGDPVQGIPPDTHFRRIAEYRCYPKEPEIAELKSGLFAKGDVVVEFYLDGPEPSIESRARIGETEYAIKSRHTDSHGRCTMILTSLTRQEEMML